MSNNKSPHSSSKEYENKPEDISVSGSFDLSHDDLDAELIPENARKCTSVYRFQNESICGEARGASDQQRNSTCDNDVAECPNTSSTHSSILALPTTTTGTASSVSTADVPRNTATTGTTNTCYLNQENDDLQKAIQLSLEYAEEPGPKTTTQSRTGTTSQQPSSRVPRPRLSDPPMEAIGNLDTLRATAQRILNDNYENENRQKVKWTELLLPEGSTKNEGIDSVETLVRLITELPTLLISTLTLSRRYHHETPLRQLDGISSTNTYQEQQQPELQSGWQPSELSADKGQQLFYEAWALLFGQKPLVTSHDFYGWWNSSFQFNTTNPLITLGLLQDQGGPCGVLASLQCWIFLHAIILRPALIPGSRQHNDLLTDDDEVTSTRSTASFSTLSSPSINETASTSDVAGPDNSQRSGEHNQYQRRFFSYISKTPSNPIRRYTFSHDGWCRSLYTTPVVGSPALTEIFSPCGCVSASALVWAICAVLYRSTPSSLYTIVCLSSNSPELLTDAQDVVCGKEGLSGVKDKIKYRIYQMNSIQQVYAFYSKFNSDLLLSRPSVLGVVLSLVLSRSVKQIRSEVDDSEFPLIGLFGHSSQELVNLFLCGQAVTNVFNGNHTIGTAVLSEQLPIGGAAATAPFREPGLDEGVQLRGISRPQIVGYLTELEALRYCEVGQYYKYPVFPIWVIGSPNHFTSIFSLDPRVSRIPASEKLLESLSRAFSDLDTTQAGIIPSLALLSLLHSTGLLDHQTEAKKVLDQDGVVLKMDFINWATLKQQRPPSQPQSLHPSLPLIPSSSHYQQLQQQLSLDPPSQFVLYHYNGQGAGGPTLTRVLVEPVDITNIQDDDDTGLGLVIRTRWKNTLVAGLPLLH